MKNLIVKKIIIIILKGSINSSYEVRPNLRTYALFYAAFEYK